MPVCTGLDLKTMSVASLDAPEIIDPNPCEPWHQEALDQVTIQQDKAQALDKVEEIGDTGADVIFNDASAKDSKVGAAVVIPNRAEGQWSTSKVGIGSTSH
jgi:hypothetical protein